MGAVGARPCLAALVGLSLAACRHGVGHAADNAPAIPGGLQQSVDARMERDAHAPRTHARSHVLLGIDLSRPLQLPECARFYNSFDRPDRACVYLRSVDHKPFKIEFDNHSAPDFLKWNNALVSTDQQGRPQMLRFEVADARALEDKAVDAMLDTFGPPTSVENSGAGSKVGTWQHDDYVIRFFFYQRGGGVVQIETKAFHDASAMPPADGEAGHAKL